MRSRVIPLGGREDPVNEKGLKYYVQLVDDLLEAGIVPMITLFHWDLPEELDKRYGGLLNKEEFVADYVRYARVIFEAMGSNVKLWITFNEPVGISSFEVLISPVAVGPRVVRDLSGVPELLGYFSRLEILFYQVTMY